MRRIVPAIVGLLCAASAQAASLNPRALRANVVLIEASSVTAEGDTTFEVGAGLIVATKDGTYFVVTADHVARDESMTPRHIRVRYVDEPSLVYPATAVPQAHDAKLDVAVIRAAGPRTKWIRRSMLPAEQVVPELPVRYLGRSGEWYYPAIEGKVASVGLGGGTIRIEGLPVSPGSSGAPLFASGGFVGIHTRYDGINLVAEGITLERIRQLVVSDWAAAAIPWELEMTRQPRIPGLAIGVSAGIGESNLRATDLDAVGAGFTRSAGDGWNAAVAGLVPARYGMFTQVELGFANRGFEVQLDDAGTGEYREEYRESVAEASLLLKRPLLLPWGFALWPQVGATTGFRTSNQVEITTRFLTARRDPEGFRSWSLAGTLGVELSLNTAGNYRIGLDARAMQDLIAPSGDSVMDHARTRTMAYTARIWR